jgi:ABC-type uncharacterized transport system auxiliary subunit
VTKRIGIILMLLALAGCLGSTRPAPLIRQHVLDYAPPHFASLAPIEDVLMVERFSASRLAAGPEMVFSPAPFQRGVYPDRRWRVDPADMVTDFLRRDLRAAGLFKAVLHPRDLDTPRFVLQGGVEAFLEVREGAGRKAVLEATVALLDLSRREVPGQVLFQKTLQVEETVVQPGAEGLAAALSRAMPRFSTQVIGEIAASLKDPTR